MRDYQGCSIVERSFGVIEERLIRTRMHYQADNNVHTLK